MKYYILSSVIPTYSLSLLPLFQDLLLNMYGLEYDTVIQVSVGEIMLGTFVEKYCQIEWWNYSSLPLHIDKYTSLFTSITFGLMITIFMNSLFFSIMKWATHINTLFFQTVVMLLFILLIADFIHEAKYMIKNKRINRIWKIDIFCGRDAI